MHLARTPIERRYVPRILVATAVYVVAVSAVDWTFTHRHPHGVTVYLLALLPAVSIFGIIAIFGMYLAAETDEFVRTVMVQSSLWATGVVLAFATFWGLLQSYAPISGSPMYLVFAVWYLAFGLAEHFVRRRYK